MKKKVMGAVVASALALSMGMVGLAFGADTVVTKTGDNNVELTYDASPSYLVSIPASTELGTDMTISVTKCILSNGQSLEVTIPDC